MFLRAVHGLEPVSDSRNCQTLRVSRQSREVTLSLIEVLCESAWEKFAQGDQNGYLQEIAEQLFRAAPSGEVIVLAQASMAGATTFCPNLTIPILSSPRLGLEAALKVYYDA